MIFILSTLIFVRNFVDFHILQISLIFYNSLHRFLYLHSAFVSKVVDGWLGPLSLKAVKAFSLHTLFFRAPHGPGLPGNYPGFPPSNRSFQYLYLPIPYHKTIYFSCTIGFSGTRCLTSYPVGELNNLLYPIENFRHSFNNNNCNLLYDTTETVPQGN